MYHRDQRKYSNMTGGNDINEYTKSKIGTSNCSKMTVNTYSNPIYDREETSAYTRFNSSFGRTFDGSSYLVGKATSKN